MSNIGLKKYLKKHKLGIEDFAALTGVSKSHMYYIARDPKANITIDTIEAIRTTTKKVFNDPLEPSEYLDRKLK